MDDAPDVFEEPAVTAEPTPQGHMALPFHYLPFQHDRILAVLALAQRVEEVDSPSDALFVLCELYAEEHEDGQTEEG